MSELLALMGRHVREVVRNRTFRVVFPLFALATLGAVVFIGRASDAPGVMWLAIPLLLALGAAAVAVGAGTALPEDRVAGREEWLATLAPPAWKRRLAVALSGWLLAAGVGAAGGLLAGIAVTILRPGTLRSHAPVAVPADTVLRGGGAGVGSDHTFDVSCGAGCAGRTLELDVKPLFLSTLHPIERVELTWRAGDGEAQTVVASVRGPLRFTALPEDARSVRLRLLTDDVNLRVRGARILGPPVEDVSALALVGLLIGIVVGCVAPFAVLVSRGTTAQTAAAAGFCLLLFGIIKGPLLQLARDLELEGMAQASAGLLRGLSHVAPDAPLLDVLGETAALRALVPSDLGLALPALLHAGVFLALVLLPGPRAWRSRSGA